jgi:predicted 2-oxoglutarate/Fe(II)-dependent dioxygenase YbiX/peroxiredoxin
MLCAMADAEGKQAPIRLERGDPAPWFRAPAVGGRADYAFDTVAGRHVLMLFFDSASRPEVQKALSAIANSRSLFDDVNASFFGVTSDLSDAESGRIHQQLPGIRFFVDPERKVSRTYGAASRPQWMLLDPTLRVLAMFALDEDEAAIAALRSELDARSTDASAPVLMIPNVLPLDLCDQLIAGYETNGGTPSGFMREVEGKTSLVVDDNHKMRRDWEVQNQSLRDLIARHVSRHLKVPVKRAFQFEATRMERYIVACYEAGAGHFRPHRDNTTKGTSHRRFAVTINLNGDEFDGGDLRFPEFGQRTYRAPKGGAIVFSCSLLHEATPVTRGKRYAFLPFLYDEAAAAQREANNQYLDPNVGEYSRQA